MFGLIIRIIKKKYLNKMFKLGYKALTSSLTGITGTTGPTGPTGGAGPQEDSDIFIRSVTKRRGTNDV